MQGVGMKGPFAVLAVTAAGLLAAGAAEAKTYFCTFSGMDVSREMLPDKVEVTIGPSGTATVLDPFILGDKGGPIPAKVKTASQNRVLLSWSLNVDADGATLRVDFRLWLPPDGGPASMTSDVLRYDPKATSKGQCKITKA
jgi:hypothetical protein